MVEPTVSRSRALVTVQPVVPVTANLNSAVLTGDPSIRTRSDVPAFSVGADASIVASSVGVKVSVCGAEVGVATGAVALPDSLPAASTALTWYVYDVPPATVV